MALLPQRNKNISIKSIKLQDSKVHLQKTFQIEKNKNKNTRKRININNKKKQFETCILIVCLQKYPSKKHIFLEELLIFKIRAVFIIRICNVIFLRKFKWKIFQ
jgi:hypothetical protein